MEASREPVALLFTFSLRLSFSCLSSCCFLRWVQSAKPSSSSKVEELLGFQSHLQVRVHIHQRDLDQIYLELNVTIRFCLGGSVTVSVLDLPAGSGLGRMDPSSGCSACSAVLVPNALLSCLFCLVHALHAVYLACGL